ncbi:MAG TPA: radical SAM protein [Thermoanaerobaculia bacterium]|nr:radical SAM protein [Thermoanaerobaculia bacterium]
MKIRLATLHCTRGFIPLSLLYLKAFLVQRQGRAASDIEIHEFHGKSASDNIVDALVAGAPDVIGLAIYVWNVKTLMAVAQRIKALSPQTTIVLGGPEVGPVATSVLRAHPYIDIVVRSEGEIPFSEIVSSLEAGRDVSSVKGICYRRADAIVENEDAPILADLNELASPHRAGYIDPKDRIICIETQRGCVFRCNFCFYNKDLSIRNRRFDLDRVKAEILYWLQQEVVEIYMMDPIFNLNAERAKDICRFVIAHNHRQVAFHAELWAEFVDEELAQLLAEANFQFLEIGLQTTDESALATVERRLRVRKFTDGIEHMKRYQLKFELQLIYGLPGETPDTFRRSLNFALSLGPFELVVFRLMILPGTELWRKAEALRLEFDPEPPYLARAHFSMTAADMAYGLKIVDAVPLLSSSKTIRFLCREPNVTFAEVVDAWIAWQDGQAPDTPVNVRARRFVADYCAAKQIPAEFYAGFASLEFGGDPMPSYHAAVRAS